MSQLTGADDPTFQLLAGSPQLSAFRKAFEEVTGLPVILAGRNAIDWGRSRAGFDLCPYLKRGHPQCAGCLKFPAATERVAPHHFRCNIGYWRTAVPLRMNGAVVAHLWTGWVLHERSDADASAWEPIRDQTTVTIDDVCDPDCLSPAMPRTKYHAAVQLLSAFAAAVHPLQDFHTVTRHAERSFPVATALEIIASEYHQALTIRAIASRCHVTSPYLSGLFRRSMHVTFTEYLARFRIEKAKELLRDRDQRVSEVAFSCGFGSHSQFNRIFLRLVGTSPRAFRAAATADGSLHSA